MPEISVREYDRKVCILEIIRKVRDKAELDRKKVFHILKIHHPKIERL